MKAWSRAASTSSCTTTLRLRCENWSALRRFADSSRAQFRDEPGEFRGGAAGQTYVAWLGNLDEAWIALQELEPEFGAFVDQVWTDDCPEPAADADGDQFDLAT